MRYGRSVLISCIGAAALAAVPSSAAAQTPAPPGSTTTTAPTELQRLRDQLAILKHEFDSLRLQYDQRIWLLEQRIAAMTGPSLPEDRQPAPAAPATTSQPPAAAPTESPQTPAAQQSVTASSKVFNPDMSVIGNFAGVAGKNPNSSDPPLSLTEAEMALQAVVDPYARADFFLSASPEGLSVEEGYLTFTSLPGGLLLRVGKMRAQFGKVNTLHTHAMPSVDRPLVTENLVGGEDGISDAGLSLSRLIANPLLFLEVTGEVFSGHSNVFENPGRSKVNYVGRLRGYRDLTEGTNLDLGVSAAFGPSNLGDAPIGLLGPIRQDLNTRLIGVDATFRYRPLRRAIYKRFQARTELIWRRQDQPIAARTTSFGFYGLGEYQFARRWYIGGRFDQSQRAFEPDVRDRGGSVFLTYWPSEFSQIRAQFRRTNYGDGVKANEFLFQFNFAIGAHGAHVF